MDVKYLDIVKKVAELDVACAKVQFMFEKSTGLKVDKMTDFILKFVYTEDLNDRDVTITILANTTMSNENTIRKKLNHLIEHNLIEICKCGCDGRTKKILPTIVLKKIMLIDTTAKIKTVESISKPFKEAFGDFFASFYKKLNLQDIPNYHQTNYGFYDKNFLYLKNRYKNTLKKLG